MKLDGLTGSNHIYQIVQNGVALPLCIAAKTVLYSIICAAQSLKTSLTGLQCQINNIQEGQRPFMLCRETGADASSE